MLIIAQSKLKLLNTKQNNIRIVIVCITHILTLHIGHTLYNIYYTFYLSLVIHPALLPPPVTKTHTRTHFLFASKRRKEKELERKRRKKKESLCS